MTALKIIYCVVMAICVVIAFWAITSYIDALINPLRQAWNFWDLILARYL